MNAEFIHSLRVLRNHYAISGNREMVAFYDNLIEQELGPRLFRAERLVSPGLGSYLDSPAGQLNPGATAFVPRRGGKSRKVRKNRKVRKSRKH